MCADIAGGAIPTDPLVGAIRDLGLSAGATAHLTNRWLDQLNWFERKAAANQSQHKRFRIATLTGGVVLPVLVNLAAGEAAAWTQAAAVAVSVVMGLAVAFESFLRPGERYVQFRQTAERLRSEWWLFVRSAGEYATYAGLEVAHRRFVERVEILIGEDVAGFVAIVAPSAGAPPAAAVDPGQTGGS